MGNSSTKEGEIEADLNIVKESEVIFRELHASEKGEKGVDSNIVKESEEISPRDLDASEKGEKEVDLNIVKESEETLRDLNAPESREELVEMSTEKLDEARNTFSGVDYLKFDPAKRKSTVDSQVIYNHPLTQAFVHSPRKLSEEFEVKVDDVPGLLRKDSSF
jgi:hypothetical protein